MSIALIVSNPWRRRGPPQHVGRGRPNPACREKGGSVGACLRVVVSLHVPQMIIYVLEVFARMIFFAEGGERSILHNIWWGDKLPPIAKVPLGPSMSYKCQSGAESPGLRLCFPVDNLIEKVSLNTSAGGARAQTHAEPDLSSSEQLTWLDAPLITAAILLSLS